MKTEYYSLKNLYLFTNLGENLRALMLKIKNYSKKGMMIMETRCRPP